MEYQHFGHGRAFGGQQGQFGRRAARVPADPLQHYQQLFIHWRGKCLVLKAEWPKFAFYGQTWSFSSPGRCHLLKVSPRAREEPSKVQQPYEEQIVVLRICHVGAVFVLVQEPP